MWLAGWTISAPATPAAAADAISARAAVRQRRRRHRPREGLAAGAPHVDGRVDHAARRRHRAARRRAEEGGERRASREQRHASCAREVGPPRARCGHHRPVWWAERGQIPRPYHYTTIPHLRPFRACSRSCALARRVAQRALAEARKSIAALKKLKKKLSCGASFARPHKRIARSPRDAIFSASAATRNPSSGVDGGPPSPKGA